MDWFLCDSDLRHKRIKVNNKVTKETSANIVLVSSLLTLNTFNKFNPFLANVSILCPLEGIDVEHWLKMG